MPPTPPAQLELGFGELFQFPHGNTCPPKRPKRKACAGFQCPGLAEMSVTLRYALELLDDDELALLRDKSAWARRSTSAAITWSVGDAG